jgi:hypothetical protein
MNVPSKWLNRCASVHWDICYFWQAAVMAASPMQSGEGTVTPIGLAGCWIGAGVSAGGSIAFVCMSSFGNGTRGPTGGCRTGAAYDGCVRTRRTATVLGWRTAGAGS